MWNLHDLPECHKIKWKPFLRVYHSLIDSKLVTQNITNMLKHLSAYPSASFSGATALVTFSVSILWMESRGSWTMRPWIAEFPFTSIMLCSTYRVIGVCKREWKGKKAIEREWQSARKRPAETTRQKRYASCEVNSLRIPPHLILCGSLGEPQVCGINSNLQ